MALFAFLTGFFSLCVQVVATQFAFYSEPHSSQATGLSLFAFLTGLGIAAKICDRRQTQLLRHFRLVVSLIFSVVGFLLFWLVLHAEGLRTTFQSWIPRLFSNPSHHYLATVTSQSLIYLLLPALGLGLLFPLINDKVAFTSRSQTGKTTSLDYLGAGVGSLFCAFVLIPYLGMDLAGGLISLSLLIAGVIFAPVWAMRLGLALIAVLLVSTNADKVARIFRFRPLTSSQVLMRKPSPYGPVLVARDRTGKATLFINGRPMCYAGRNRAERLLAKGPLAELARPDIRVLNIGLGCGFTALQFKNHSRVRNLDIVEINPVVISAQKHFALNLESPLGATTKIIQGDGYRFVEETEKSYDIVAVDVEEPSIIHSSPLFTVDFFKRTQAKLASGGILTLWTFAQKETGRVILNSLKSVFPFVDVIAVQNSLVFFAAASPIYAEKWNEDPTLRSEILQSPIAEVATIARNPYSKYFKVQEVFQFPLDYSDHFEMKKDTALKN